MRLAVISDTHIPVRARGLPSRALDVIRGCDELLHAGDVVTPPLLDELGAVLPVHAVRGNNDAALPASVPERLAITVEGVRIGLVHDSGPAGGRRRRMRSAFPACRVVVVGHSHIPLLEDDGDLLLLNPGSPTDRRRMPTFTMAVLSVEGEEARAEIVDLGRERG